MHFLNRLTAVFLALVLAGATLPLEAKSKKGDKYLAEGRVHEAKKEWDAALESYEKALAEDPAEMVYQMAVDQARFQDAQEHIERGIKIRGNGQLGEALLEFQKAYTVNPGSSVAQQELMLTKEMIERERKRVEETGHEAPPDERSLTPAQESKKQTQERIDRMLPVPELKPLNPEPIRDLKINGQPVKVLYETIGKVAGVNVLWDPDYQPPSKNNFNVDFENATLEQALDYVGVITKSYWKPLSTNAIFVTNDNPNKRRDFEEMVAQTFYLTNVSSPQEIQEIVNAVRSIAELQRVVAFTSQNAIIVRGEADKVALAAKMIHDLDKPRSEVVVDIMVMEASTSFTRQLSAAIASTGLNVPFNFNPRTSIQVQNSTSTSSTSSTTPSTTSTTSSTTGTSTATGTTGTYIPLSNLGHLSSADFATTLPSALLQAALSDTKTKVLQAPQLRSVDGVKATLKIGEREPTASGSFASTISSVSPLVSTQFNYIDVGVNVTLLPHVHDNGDISMDIDLEISSVTGTVNLGGLSEPIIGQRKVTHSVRMREGEVSLLAGLNQTTDTNQVTGIPGLMSIPLLKWLFQGQSIDRENDDVMIVLVPHIVRQPSVTAENLRGIDVGSQAAVKLNYAPRQSDLLTGPQAAAIVSGEAAAPGVPANQNTVTTPPATAPPLPGPPATAPPPAGSAHVQFSPGQVQTRVGGSVVVSVTLEGGTDVAFAPLEVHFDPKVLRLNDVAPGTLLANDGQQPVFTKNVMNDNGTATVQLNRRPGTPGVNGSGTLISLQFQAVGRGATEVSIPQVNVRDSHGQPVATGSTKLTVNVQ
jgi:general secretion pathway protein D